MPEQEQQDCRGEEHDATGKKGEFSGLRKIGLGRDTTLTIANRCLDDGELSLKTQIKRRHEADGRESDHDSHPAPQRDAKNQEVEEHDTDACPDKKGVIHAKKPGRLPVQRLGQNMPRNQLLSQQEGGKEVTADDEGELPDWKRLQERSDLATIDDNGNHGEKVVAGDSQHVPLLVVFWYGWTTRPIPG